jgi:hypothetical protein
MTRSRLTEGGKKRGRAARLYRELSLKSFSLLEFYSHDRRLNRFEKYATCFDRRTDPQATAVRNWFRKRRGSDLCDSQFTSPL